MSYIITGDCLNCGACLDECPQGAITEGDDKSCIDPVKCNGCGYCVSDFFCPAQAIIRQ